MDRSEASPVSSTTNAVKEFKVLLYIRTAEYFFSSLNRAMTDTI